MVRIDPEDERIVRLATPQGAIYYIRKQRRDVEHIGLRGVMTSCGDEIVIGELDFRKRVKNIRRTLHDGTELDASTRVTRLVVDCPADAIAHDQYCIRPHRVIDRSDPRRLRLWLERLGNQKAAELLRPAILCYDISHLNYLGGHGGYDFQLPEDPEERSKAISLACIIDPLR